MADPLSVTASIAGVISLAEVVVTKGYRLYRTAKDCPKEVKALIDETSSLYDVLGRLKCQALALQPTSSIKITPSQIPLNSPLINCQQTLELVDKILTGVQAKPDESIRNAAKRVQWIFKKDDVIDAMAKLERHKCNFHLALQLDEMEKLEQVLAGNLEILQQVLDSKAEVLSTLEKIEKNQLDAQVTEEQRHKDIYRDEVLRWLSAIDFHSKHSIIQESRSPNTGTWFLESEEFVDWLEREAPAVLWCQGSPGAGKTYLTSVIIDYLKSRNPGGGVGLAYIYCDFDQRVNLKPKLVLASILQQLAYQRPNLNSNTDALYKTFQEEGQSKRPELKDLLSAILSTSQEFSTVYLVFDALDECHEETQRKDLFIALAHLSQAPFRVLVTSRPHPVDIQIALKQAKVATICAQDNDIELFVRGMINKERSNGVKISAEVESGIIKKILLHAKEIFLLATFQIKAILEHKTQKRMKKAAESLTSNLKDNYDRIMNTINQLSETDRNDALNILAWISASTRPLQLTELQVAVAVEDDDCEVDEDAFLDAKTIVDYCGGLVTIEQETGKARFVHYTVQEYLLTLEDLTPEKSHFRVAKTCLTYLSFASSDEDSWHPDNLRSGDATLWDYVSMNWGLHLRALNQPGDLDLRALSILQCTPLVQELAAKQRGSGAQSKALHLASHAGLVRLVELLLDSCNTDVNSIGAFGSTPISMAAAEGHEEVAKLLLDRQDVNPDSKDTDGRTPLSRAAGNGHEGVVRLLLGRQDVNPNSKGTYGMSPLSWAAGGGHEKVIRLLLDRPDVNPDPKDMDGMTPLSRAAINGREGVVRLLLDRQDVNPDSKDTYGMTPLSWAAGNGHEVVVMLLLDRQDVNPDPNDTNGVTPLSRAAINGREGVVRLLLDRQDVNPDSKDTYGMTPLSRAAGSGHRGVVRLLLDRQGVNPDSKDMYGMTPLSEAAFNGHEWVVRLLLDRGDVNPNSEDNGGRTPLSWAANNGHEEVARLLLDRQDINPDPKDTGGRTPLSWAAGSGHGGVVGLLLDRGDVNSNSEDKRGRTPLAYATLWRYNTVVKILNDRLEADDTDSIL